MKRAVFWVICMFLDFAIEGWVIRPFFFCRTVRAFVIKHVLKPSRRSDRT